MEGRLFQFFLLNVIIIIISCLLASQCSHGENLSNVFVLETSDSDATPLSLVSDQASRNQETSVGTRPKVKLIEESNTRIIVDGTSNHSNDNGHKLDEHQKESHTNEYHGSSLHTRNTNQQHHSTTHRPTARSTTTSSTTTTTSTSRPTNNRELPSRETNRNLFIHFTSSSQYDDQADRKPQRNPLSSSTTGSLGHDGGESAPSAQYLTTQNQPPKREPSITISFQDANLNNKQTGLIGGGGSAGSSGSAAAAVIVSPGEDGQSIVIATVNANPNSIKFNQNNNNNRPLDQLPQVTQNNPHSSGVNQNEQANREPYREPANNPIQSIINQHQVTSTTRRPSYVPTSDYGQALPGARPTSNDERPVRPVAPSLVEDTLSSSSGSSGSGGGGGSHYELAPHRPSQRPASVEPSSPAGSSSLPSGGYDLNERSCGLLQETKIVGGEEANPDDFMWMAAIVKAQPKSGQPKPFCGGSLITRRHILTAAHCLEGLAPRDVLVRLGSYDFDDSTASSLSADFAIDQFRVPAQYSKKSHAADIAIMRLKTPLSANDNYKTVCMAQPRRSYVGALGTVIGYGSQSQTFRIAAPKLRQVTVPIWENRKCSTMYKRNLTDSFLCAGYEQGGQDACQGDSGGPLMVEGPEQRMMLVGVVSHGIGCGAPGYPGVYTRVTTFMDWIDKNTRE